MRSSTRKALANQKLTLPPKNLPHTVNSQQKHFEGILFVGMKNTDTNHRKMRQPPRKTRPNRNTQRGRGLSLSSTTPHHSCPTNHQAPSTQHLARISECKGALSLTSCVQPGGSSGSRAAPLDRPSGVAATADAAVVVTPAPETPRLLLWPDPAPLPPTPTTLCGETPMRCRSNGNGGTGVPGG